MRNVGLLKSVARSIFLLTVFPSFSLGSSTVAIVTPHGIVVGVDEKSVNRCDAPCPFLNESKKLVVLQGHVTLGTAGLYTIIGNHFLAPYHFPSLVNVINSRLPADARVSEVSEIVDEEARKVFLWFDLYLRNRLIKREDFPAGHPVDYLIAGYEAGTPTVYAVYVDVDWQQLHSTGVQRILMHPTSDDNRHSALYGVGSTRALQQLTDRRGDLYRRVTSKAAVESRRLLGQKSLSLDQASKLVRALLEVEADANPEHVGPPFTIVSIPNGGPRRAK